MRKQLLWALAFFALAIMATAQTSTSYQLSEHTFNQGGHPEGGTTLSSASFQVSLDAVGEGVTLLGQGSTSYQVDSSLPNAYPPPEEVLNLSFSDGTTLLWNPEDSTGTYSVYRGDTADLGTGYGACSQGNLTSPTATDSDTPTPGQCFFYIVTADNLLQEEGTLGDNSSGSERANPGSCP